MGIMKTTLALVAAGFMAAAPAFAQGTAGGTPNTGPQGTGNFVAGKPEGTGNPVAGKPGDPPAAKAGANTSGAGAGASSTSAGDMGGTNASKK
jgi:hypothetical protein